MRLTELHLKAFGPFTDQVLPLGADKQMLVIVHGLNEAGKSSALRAISALRFGIPGRSEDNFVHDYKQMRVGGVFVDATGKKFSLMRRKGTGNTVRQVDFELGGLEDVDAVSADIHRLLTAGLSPEDYQSMFGLDHDTLRRGGRALVKGEGEIGAALFEASSGVENVTKILAELDATAKSYYSPAAQSRNARINMALIEYKGQVEQYKEAQVKPTKWEAVAKASRDATAQLQAAQKEHNKLSGQQLQLRELIAVGPILAALEQANRVTQELDHVPLLAENAPAERATTEAGLSDALADMQTNQTEIKDQSDLIDTLDLDPDILALSQSVSRLHAAAATISQLRSQAATAESDRDSRTLKLNALAVRISTTLQLDELLQRAPTATGKAHIKGIIDALEEAERALLQHKKSAPGETAVTSNESTFVPDTTLLATVRVALAEVARNNETLQQLRRLPIEIKAAERSAQNSLAAVNLTDEKAARRVRPLLGATIDQARQELTELASKRAEKIARIEEMESSIAEHQAEIAALLAHGKVPTHEDVRNARAHRQIGWNLVKQLYIEGAAPDVEPFAQGQALPQVYEKSVADADSIIDELASDTARTAELESVRRQLVELERDKLLRQDEITSIDAQQKAFDMTWEQNLSQAGIPFMPPAELRDWQELLQTALTELNNLQAKHDELIQAKDAEKSLVDKLRQSITSLGLTVVDVNDPLDTLVVVAEDDVRQVERRIADRNNAAGQAMQLQKQTTLYTKVAAELFDNAELAKREFAAQMGLLLLGENATVAMANARLTEFEELVTAKMTLEEAKSRLKNYEGSLFVYKDIAQGIADALSEQLSDEITLAAERWSTRLALAQDKQTKLNLTEQRLNTARKALAENQAKESRHQATLTRLCASAKVQTSMELPAAEEQSIRKRQSIRDADAASDQLAKATRLGLNELQNLLAGREHETLRTEESLLAHELIQAGKTLEQARSIEESARRDLDNISSSDAAAAATDAMARAAATVRNTLPLQIRSRLAHALLQEAMRRFKERSQAPMLKSASGYFTQITGGEFEGLQSDDSGGTHVIVGKRRDGQILAVEAMSEGTRDQLYLALRLAALKLQRDRGVDLPVILDDVLMASDDVRAGHIFKALADFSKTGQVIIFTHHNHLCDVARRNVCEEALAVVEIKHRC